MAEFPAMPLWTDAYLADTGHLTTIEHGAYLLLMFAAWRNGGWLPNDDKRLSRFARLTSAQWARIKPTILEFFHVDGERLVQSRLTDELDAVRQRSKVASNNARAKHRKNKKQADAAAEQKSSETAASISIVKTPIAPLQKNQPDDFDRFFSAYPKRKGSNPSGPAREKFERAVRGGVDPEAIISAAGRYAAQQRELRNIDTEFVMQAVTWLNQKCWNDYPAEPAKREGPTPVWVCSDEHRWKILADRQEREKGTRPSPMTLTTKPAPGNFFPADWVADVNLDIPERLKRTEAA